MQNIPRPVNTQERYQYETLRRVDALCNMVASLIEHIAEKEQVATTNHVEVEKDITTEVEPVERCQAITAKGTQCKRDAIDGQFCSTHQPKE